LLVWWCRRRRGQWWGKAEDRAEERERKRGDQLEMLHLMGAMPLDTRYALAWLKHLHPNHALLRGDGWGDLMTPWRRVSMTWSESGKRKEREDQDRDR